MDNMPSKSAQWVLKMLINDVKRSYCDAIKMVKIVISNQIATPMKMCAIMLS
jgi:hypothetical protein